MIGRISGRLLIKQPPQIIVDVNGIGYEIDVPMSTLYQLPATGAEVTLYTHLIGARGRAPALRLCHRSRASRCSAS